MTVNPVSVSLEQEEKRQKVGVFGIRQPLWKLSHEAAPDGKGGREEGALEQEGLSGCGEVMVGWTVRDSEVTSVILSSFV